MASPRLMMRAMALVLAISLVWLAQATVAGSDDDDSQSINAIGAESGMSSQDQKQEGIMMAAIDAADVPPRPNVLRRLTHHEPGETPNLIAFGTCYGPSGLLATHLITGTINPDGDLIGGDTTGAIDFVAFPSCASGGYQRAYALTPQQTAMYSLYISISSFNAAIFVAHCNKGTLYETGHYDNFGGFKDGCNKDPNPFLQVALIKNYTYYVIVTGASASQFGTFAMTTYSSMLPERPGETIYGEGYSRPPTYAPTYMPYYGYSSQLPTGAIVGIVLTVLAAVVFFMGGSGLFGMRSYMNERSVVNPDAGTSNRTFYQPKRLSPVFPSTVPEINPTFRQMSVPGFPVADGPSSVMWSRASGNVVVPEVVTDEK